MARHKCLRSKPLAANCSARSLSNSGCVGWFSGSMSSMGLTKPRPSNCDQMRFTIALLKYGFSGDVAQLASTGRYGSLLDSFASAPPRNLAGTVLADSGNGLSRRFGRADSVTPAEASILSFLGRTIVALTFVKNWAIPQYSVCFQDVNGWLWH